MPVRMLNFKLSVILFFSCASCLRRSSPEPQDLNDPMAKFMVSARKPDEPKRMEWFQLQCQRTQVKLRGVKYHAIRPKKIPWKDEWLHIQDAAANVISNASAAQHPDHAKSPDSSSIMSRS